MSLVAYGDSSSDSEVEEGSRVPETAKSDVRKLLGLLPPPKGKKSSDKQPIRISLPTFKSGNGSDDDEDDESPQVKRVKIKGGNSRLTALLPQPKAIPKQLGGGGGGGGGVLSITATTTTTTPSMVPYTLSKRKQHSIKSEKIKSMKAKSRGKIRKHSTTDGGSDSDDEPVSFFSHLEETASSKTTEIETTVVAPLKISSVVATPLDSDATHSSIDQKESDDDRSVASNVADITTQSHTGLSWNQYNHHHIHTDHTPYTHTHTASSVPSQQQQQQEHYYAMGQFTGTSNSDAGASEEVDEDVKESGGPPTGEVSVGEGGDGASDEGMSEEGGGEVMAGAGPGVIIDQQALRRLAGGNKRKGREEALNNIVDIIGDDVMEDVRVYQRHYGEDPSITKLYKPDKSKLKTPTGQQKRKHQITWLAHEAKEREFELQKQWAAGSNARRDTRSKYGF